jgi:hypothetical protein
MNWLGWLGLAVVVTAVAAVTGIQPEHARLVLGRSALRSECNRDVEIGDRLCLRMWPEYAISSRYLTMHGVDVRSWLTATP